MLKKLSTSIVLMVHAKLGKVSIFLLFMLFPSLARWSFYWSQLFVADIKIFVEVVSPSLSSFDHILSIPMFEQVSCQLIFTFSLSMFDRWVVQFLLFSRNAISFQISWHKFFYRLPQEELFTSIWKH